MSGFLENRIDSLEKKIPVDILYKMYSDRKLLFPAIPWPGAKKRTEKVSGTVEAILMGIIIPAVYTSELQDGSLLVLDTGDELRFLLEFLEGKYPVGKLEFYPELDGYDIRRMEQEFPRATLLLMDFPIQLQIIEYTTPRYMHMQVGRYIEKWNFTREQGIRNILYGEELEGYLQYLADRTRHYGDFFSKWQLNRQYMMLRILMYHFVLFREIREGREENTGLPLLLEITADILKRKNHTWKNRMADEMCCVMEELQRWSREERVDLAKEKGKESQAKTVGYLSNVVWMCWKKDYPVWRGLKRISNAEVLWEQIVMDKVNETNIRKHFKEIEERLRQDAETYQN